MAPILDRIQRRRWPQLALDAVALAVVAGGLLLARDVTQLIAVLALPAIVVGARHVMRYDRRAHTVAVPAVSLLAATVALDFREGIAGLVDDVNQRAPYDALTHVIVAGAAIAAAALAWHVRRTEQRRMTTVAKMLYAAVFAATIALFTSGLTQVGALIITGTVTALVSLRFGSDEALSWLSPCLPMATAGFTVALSVATDGRDAAASSALWRLTAGWLGPQELASALVAVAIAATVVMTVALVLHIGDDRSAVATGAVVGAVLMEALLALASQWLGLPREPDVVVQLCTLGACAGAMLYGIDRPSLMLMFPHVSLAGASLSLWFHSSRATPLAADVALGLAGSAASIAIVVVSFRRVRDARPSPATDTLASGRAGIVLRGVAAVLAAGQLVAVGTVVDRQPYQGDVVNVVGATITITTRICLNTQSGGVKGGTRVTPGKLNADGSLDVTVGDRRFETPITTVGACGWPVVVALAPKQKFMSLSEGSIAGGEIDTFTRYWFEEETRYAVIADVVIRTRTHVQSGRILVTEGDDSRLPLIVATAPARRVR